MRDGTSLMADVHRPDGQGRVAALIAASPYPRQIQDLGAPMGFIEAGATDFWVPRGYHRIQLTLASDDQDTSIPAIMNFRHASVGTSSLNTIRSSSRLLLPVLT